MNSRRSLRILFVIMLIGLFLPISAIANHELQYPAIRPVIFIHGGGGTAAQFEAQAQRFTSNGYPENYIAAYEWDTTKGLNLSADEFEAIFQGVDDLIDNLREETGADKVELTGHSMGGGITIRYLASSPERANRVAHYVAFEGAVTSVVKNFDVPMMCIWGENYKTANYPGAINVVNYGQTHTQTAVSAETFLTIYRFFNGVDPVTTDILPEPRGQIRVSGRAIIYRQNVGVAGATLDIYKVDGLTGFRLQKKPEASYLLGEDGYWGPFKAKSDEYYEFVIVRGGNQNHHFYYEPFIRTDHFIRLNTSTEPDGGSTAFMERSDHHTNLVVTKGEEFLGAQALNDVLLIDGVNIVTPVTVPGTGKPQDMINALYIYDRGTDGVSNIVIAPGLVDLYIPGAYPPDATINVALQARDGGGQWQVLNVPNWASSYTRRITVQFKTYVQ